MDQMGQMDQTDQMDLGRLGEPWAALDAELAAWRAAGRKARFWWRDDDAVSWTRDLARLIALIDGQALGLAVIPSGLETGFAEALAPHPNVEILLHGWSHTNHAPAGAKKSEFGSHRSAQRVRKDIAAGHARLRAVFGDSYVPLLVPPWNRISPEAALIACGSGPVAVSTHLDRKSDAAVPHLNSHADVLDWDVKKRTNHARFIGTETVVIALRDAFRRRRMHAPGTDPSEAVGLLTHHLQHDEETWQFLETFMAFIAGRKEVDWTSPRRELQRSPA